MLSEENRKELQRLRRDFEAQASQYHDLTLSVYFITHASLQDTTKFKHPNHAVMLWQYMGNFTPETKGQEFFSFQPNDYGLTQAEVTAIGVVEGGRTDLFRRMAYRAGSLIVDSVGQLLTIAITANFADPKWTGKPVFAGNRDPLAVWLNFALMCVATFQPGRFQRQTLTVDPFTASLAVFDHFLDKVNSPLQDERKVRLSPLLDRRFKVALSFPGEKREFVAQVAEGLRERLGDIFYDQYFEAELAQPDLDILLQKIYHDNSELIVVFTCKDYERKEWCGLEWRAIRDLLKKGKGNIIMPMRFDDTVIPGLFSIDGYIDLQRHTPEQTVNLICQRIDTQQVTL